MARIALKRKGRSPNRSVSAGLESRQCAVHHPYDDLNFIIGLGVNEEF